MSVMYLSFAEHLKQKSVLAKTYCTVLTGNGVVVETSSFSPGPAQAEKVKFESAHQHSMA